MLGGGLEQAPPRPESRRTGIRCPNPEESVSGRTAVGVHGGWGARQLGCTVGPGAGAGHAVPELGRGVRAGRRWAALGRRTGSWVQFGPSF